MITIQIRNFSEKSTGMAKASRDRVNFFIVVLMKNGFKAKETLNLITTARGGDKRLRRVFKNLRKKIKTASEKHWMKDNEMDREGKLLIHISTERRVLRPSRVGDLVMSQKKITIL